MKRVVVLISGGGRNLQALLDAGADGRLDAQIVAVISNRDGVQGLERARRAGVAALALPHVDFPSREAFDAALAEAIEAQRPDIVVMAGFMRVVGAAFVRRFQGRMLNIHPSLLPRHPGLKTHQKVLEAGEREHGATVHFVTEELDGGPLIIQGQFSVMPQDSAESLAERVMQDIELKIYPQAVAWLARGDVELVDGGVRFGGRPLSAPLGMDHLEAQFR
ncbi:phosphoribosylglycinamide formyltransferase [Solimonas sp. K1W22B-7]|uniref:phosphoribosylglycinamide formyltransferase n=1 Tax=Solimonas sp. K1W22B-7 TaxID=2303331 RepID=UPI000E335A66|nr:phosphoribosylglycinamide formyltransferase [Solimonas sp. K1W22B-7]AXQ28620.1 phosphoribosylglycinamide formyltransferase [Solimonas sp. K1W22B-7]